MMTKLKYLCLLFSVVSIAAAITNIGSVSISSPVPESSTQVSMIITLTGVYDRIGAIAYAFIFAAFAYGIHIRAPIVWKAGFIGIVLTYVDFVTEGIVGTIQAAPVQDFADFWLPIGLVVVGGTAVCAYAGILWKRQRPYFQQPQ